MNIHPMKPGTLLERLPTQMETNDPDRRFIRHERRDRRIGFLLLVLGSVAGWVLIISLVLALWVMTP